MDLSKEESRDPYTLCPLEFLTHYTQSMFLDERNTFCFHFIANGCRKYRDVIIKVPTYCNNPKCWAPALEKIRQDVLARKK